MLRTTRKDNTDCEYQIIGAQSRSSNADAASLVLCNYDDDSKLTYRLGEICVRDHFGDGAHNGFGNMFFRTNANATTTQDIATQMCILYNGNVGINTPNPVSKLHVNGGVKMTEIDYETTSDKEPILQMIVTSNRIYDSNMYRHVGTCLLDMNPSQTRIPTHVIVRSHLEPISIQEYAQSNYIYDIRLYNVSTNMILGDMTCSNFIPSLSTIGLTMTSNTLMNSNMNIIELHMKKGSLGSYVSLDSVLFIYT